MNIPEQIENYIASQPEPKQSELQTLHDLIIKTSPECKLWFDTGVNSDGKVVANPTAGYGKFTIKYADGKTKEWFRIGLAANATGISVYILGIADKSFLVKTFGEKLGKAKVTGYCIRFKTLKDTDIDVLGAAIRYGIEL